MENDEQYYTFRLWKCSNRGLSMFRYDQFQEACCWEKISLLSVFAFPTVNVFLEGDRAGSWWKPFIFLDEAGFTLAMTWRRVWEPSGWERPRTMFSIPNNSTECNHGFTSIHSLSPCIYPILPFPYCNPTEEFFSTWRWKVHNRPPHKRVTLLQAIDDACNDITGGDQCQACICHAGRFFLKMFN